MKTQHIQTYLYFNKENNGQVDKTYSGKQKCYIFPLKKEKFCIQNNIFKKFPFCAIIVIVAV